MIEKDLLPLIKNKNVFILSPHFDDAVLSLGSFIKKYNDHLNFTVVNIFTKSHKGPYTLSGKKALKNAGFFNGVELYKKRQEDDSQVMRNLGIKKIDLDYYDALYRRKLKPSFAGKIFPELDHYYPTYRWHIIKQKSKSDTSVNNIVKELSSLIPSDAYIIAPLGVGNHVDHKITRFVAENIRKYPLYYIDFPYIIREQKKVNKPNKYISIKISVALNQKQKLIEGYTTEINSLFEGGKVPPHVEEILIPENFALWK